MTKNHINRLGLKDNGFEIAALEHIVPQNFFSPDKLTIQPGDTVTFENAQDVMHEVMFIDVPKGVNEMIMSPMQVPDTSPQLGVIYDL